MDVLKVEGKEPVASEMLTMLVMVLARTGRHCLSKDVWIASRSHCLSGAELMRRLISSTVAGRKDESLDGAEGGSGECGDDAVEGIADRRRMILSEKNDAND